MRRLVAIAAVAVLTSGACSDRRGAAATSTAATVASSGPLSPALLNPSQLRRVPGFATAKVVGVEQVAVFDEPDPRGPCGAVVPRVPLTDAMGASWEANTILGGVQLVVRRPARELQQFMAARIRDAVAGCAPFAATTRLGGSQEMKFENPVGVTRDADQSLAVVMAVKVNTNVRAATIIEVRTGNLLSRAVVYTQQPMANATVRGLASLMAKSLQAVS